MKGVIITIAGNDLACARRWGADCKANVRGPNYTGLMRNERFLDSYLGQLAWLRWCRLYGLRCRYKVITDGKSVYGKFALYADGEPRECIVKTAGFAWYKEFMLPVEQAVDERALYVGMRLRCEADTDLDTAPEVEVECWGKIEGVWVATLPVGTFGDHKIPTRHRLLTDLDLLGPVRNYDQGDLELLGRAVELAPTLRLTLM